MKTKNLFWLLSVITKWLQYSCHRCYFLSQATGGGKYAQHVIKPDLLYTQAAKRIPVEYTLTENCCGYGIPGMVDSGMTKSKRYASVTIRQTAKMLSRPACPLGWIKLMRGPAIQQ